MIFILVFGLKEGRTGNFLKKLFVSDGMILTAFEVFLLVDSSTFYWCVTFLVTERVVPYLSGTSLPVLEVSPQRFLFSPNTATR